MKKVCSIAICIISIFLVLQACKKGENDPVTLKSRSSRLEGDWKCTSYSEVSDIVHGSDPSLVTNIFDGTTFTYYRQYTLWGNIIEHTEEAVGSLELSFSKSGTYERTIIKQYVETNSTIDSTINEEGIWFWTDENDQLGTKSKEGVVLQVTEVTTEVSITYSSGDPVIVTETQSFEGYETNTEVILFDRLDKEELIVKMTGNYSYVDEDNGSYNKSTTLDATYTKD